MKKLIYLSIISILPSFAFGKSLDANEAFAKCLRKTIDSRRINQDSIIKTMQLIEEFNAQNGEELAQACQNDLKANKKIKKIKFDKIEELIHKHSAQSRHASQILEKLVTNFTICQVGGVEVDVAAVVGIGAGVMVGKCHSYNGKKWIALAPSASINAGAGVSLMGTKLKLEFERGQLISDVNDLILNAAIVPGMKWTYDGNLQSIGVGLSIMMGFRQSLLLKLIPIKNDFNSILADLNFNP